MTDQRKKSQEKQVHTIDFAPGMHISRAAEQLVEAAKKHGAAEGSFNGIALRADATTTAAVLVAHYDAECEQRSEEYRRSPEGQDAQRRSDEERASLQARHDALMRRLPTLDFGNDVAVLNWLCQMQEPSDRMGVITRRNTILSTFAKHGFLPGVNCGADFRPESRENVHRWLVGQCLSGLEGPAIHSIVHKFARDWRAKFVHEKESVS